MYLSNQQRLKKYVEERRLEEANAEIHQQKLYDKIASDLGEDVQATNYANLAKRVVSKIGDAIQTKPIITKDGKEQLTGMDILKRSIKEGKLSELFTKIVGMGKAQLSSLPKKEQLIVKDLKNPATRQQITESFNNDIEGKMDNPDAITQSLIDNVAGGDASALNNIIGKLERSSSTSSQNSEYAETTSTNISSILEDLNKEFPGQFNGLQATLEIVMKKLGSGTKEIPLFSSTNNLHLGKQGPGKPKLKLILSRDGAYFGLKSTKGAPKAISNEEAKKYLQDLDQAQLKKELIKIQ